MKSRGKFMIAATLISFAIAGTGLLRSRQLDSQLAGRISTCQTKTAAHLQPTVGKHQGDLKIEQIIELAGVAKVEFPMGTKVEEIRVALARNFPTAHVPMFEQSKAPDLHEQGAIKATYRLTANDGTRYDITGPAGSEKAEVLKIATNYLVAGCTPSVIDSANYAELNKEQEEVRSALLEKRHGPGDGWIGLAALFLIVGAVPYVWYFLLNRIAEVADAVRRK